MDTEPLETHVYVHSPLIEYSVTGGYYTSYAIHLTSNNPCFSRPTSHIRRRYSEFARFRELLVSHHPSIKPPALPPKNFFDRFNDDFIDQRMEGLQKFLSEVLSTPVYLSDKGLHLFLQSTTSMHDISQECFGDIPAPPLIDPAQLHATLYSEKCSKSNRSYEVQHCTKSLKHLVIDDERRVQPQITVTRTSNFDISSSEQNILTLSLPKCENKRILTLSLPKCENKPILIPRRNGSLDSSTLSSLSSSPSSLESYSSSSERAKDRRVSFNDTVKVAVVTHYGISVLRP